MSGFTPPKTYRTALKKRLIRINKPFDFGDLESWCKTQNISDAEVADLDPSGKVCGQPNSDLIAGLKKDVENDIHLVSFAQPMSGNHYCWDPKMPTFDDEFAIRHYGQGNDEAFAPTFGLFLLRHLIEELACPLDSFSDPEWESYDGKSWNTVMKRTLSLFKVVSSVEIFELVSELLERPVHEDESVFHDGEAEGILKAYFSSDYSEGWENVSYPCS